MYVCAYTGEVVKERKRIQVTITLDREAYEIFQEGKRLYKMSRVIEDFLKSQFRQSLTGGKDGGKESRGNTEGE